MQPSTTNGQSIAKQLNVVTTQLGVDAKKIVMNVGTATVGYGYEYVVSTMDRIKGAALGQNDLLRINTKLCSNNVQLFCKVDING